MGVEEIADALGESQTRSTDQRNEMFSPHCYATYMGSEPVDTNLSVLRLADGTLVHGCPKYKSVTGLFVGATVECTGAGPNKPLTIAGIIEGDITKYVAP